jgi:hypothetical protein
MLDLETLKTAPVPLLGYIGHGKYVENLNFGAKDSATTYWLYQDVGESYRLEWWTNGWVVFYQESYLTKDLHFKHKNDISSFAHSHFGSSKGWQHVFQTRELAVETFKKFWSKLQGWEENNSTEGTADCGLSYHTDGDGGETDDFGFGHCNTIKKQ